jgi:hypothetical protein
VTETRVLAAGNGGKIAALLLGLEAKGLIADPIQVLHHIPQGKHRRQAATRLAYGYGRSGRIKDVERLLAREEFGRVKQEYAARIRLLAFIGYSTRLIPSAQGSSTAQPGPSGYDPAFLGLIDSYIDGLSEEQDLSGFVRFDLTGIALRQMALSGQAERAKKILEFGSNLWRPADCGLVAALGEGLIVTSPATNLSGLIEQCRDVSRGGRTSEFQADLRRKLAYRTLLAKGIQGLQTYTAVNDFHPLSQDQIEDTLFTAKNEDDLVRKVEQFLPDILLLERTLPPEQIALISRNDSWAARLARNYVDPIALLSRRTCELEATGISNVLLDLLMRQHADPKDASQSDIAAVIQSLAACDHREQARQVLVKYREHLDSQKRDETVDERLTTFSMLIVAASRVGDAVAIKKFARDLMDVTFYRPQVLDEAGRVTAFGAPAINEPTVRTGTEISRAVMPVWKVDPVPGYVLLTDALYYASLLGDDV